jgi:hypothetical protein
MFQDLIETSRPLLSPTLEGVKTFHNDVVKKVFIFYGPKKMTIEDLLDTLMSMENVVDEMDLPDDLRDFISDGYAETYLSFTGEETTRLVTDEDVGNIFWK